MGAGINRVEKKSNLGRQEIARRYLHLGLFQLCA